MRHAKLAFLAGGTAALVAVAACSSATDTATYSDGSSGGASSSSSGNPSVDGGSASPATEGVTATGVLLVHAAAFPAFRLCFENMPNLVPQPDRSLMPEANVVGVEIGSLVRIDPMAAPGKVYVVREAAVRSAPGQSGEPTCGEIVAPPTPGGGNTFTQNNEYFVATSIDEPLGQDKVSVLAITGCGGEALLTYALGLSSASCGADWDRVKGNLKAKVVTLNATRNPPTDQSIPVQLFQMSQAVQALQGTTGALDVTFGDLKSSDGGTTVQHLDTGALFSGGAQTELAFNQTDTALYGSWGFRVALQAPGNDFTLEQSLAQVQELSSPRDVPTTYYRAASNYALLLLGDPTHSKTFADGGLNPLYNPRQELHLLAVPVIDPSTVDAGADGDASATGDGGT